MKIEDITHLHGRPTYRINDATNVRVDCITTGTYDDDGRMKMKASIVPFYALQGEERKAFIEWFQTHNYPGTAIEFLDGA